MAWLNKNTKMREVKPQVCTFKDGREIIVLAKRPFGGGLRPDIRVRDVFVLHQPSVGADGTLEQSQKRYQDIGVYRLPKNRQKGDLHLDKLGVKLTGVGRNQSNCGLGQTDAEA